jgi:hypothetical protein
MNDSIDNDPPDADHRPPRAARHRRMTNPTFASRRWLTLGVVCLGVLMVVLDVTSRYRDSASRRRRR